VMRDACKAMRNDAFATPLAGILEMKMRALEMFGEGGNRVQAPERKSDAALARHASTNPTFTPDYSRPPTPLRGTPSPGLVAGGELMGSEYSGDWTEPLVAEPLIRCACAFCASACP